MSYKTRSFLSVPSDLVDRVNFLQEDLIVRHGVSLSSAFDRALTVIDPGVSAAPALHRLIVRLLVSLENAIDVRDAMSVLDDDEITLDVTERAFTARRAYEDALLNLRAEVERLAKSGPHAHNALAIRREAF